MATQRAAREMRPQPHQQQDKSDDRAESFDEDAGDGPEEGGSALDRHGSAGGEDLDDFVGGSNVRVIVRVRPLLEHEVSKAHACSLLHIDQQRVRAVQADADDAAGAVASHPISDISVQTKESVHRFSFDAVLTPQHTQRDVFEAGHVGRMLRALLKGYHGTIFGHLSRTQRQQQQQQQQQALYPYGQTGSGKTHSMDGCSYSTKQVAVSAGRHVVTHDGGDTTPLAAAPAKTKTVRVIREPSADDSGLSLRCINELFALVATRQSHASSLPSTSDDASNMRFVVKCSFIQIYQESVYDLLSDTQPQYVQRHDGVGGSHKAASTSNAGLRIRWSPSKNFYVENLYVFECKSAKEARNYFLNGMKKRLVASHRMNQSSSRSHSIFTLYVEQQHALFPAKIVHSKLSLVDLAGSERAALTGATGQVLQQSIGINKSLFVLRKVIKSLSKLAATSGIGTGTSGDGQAGLDRVSKALAHVPYRDSTLTRLLQHSLGGNSVTLMLACLSPSDAYVDENLSTLNYAGLAKRIANNASVNEDPHTALIRKLRAEIKMLRGMLARANQTFVLGQAGGTARTAGGTLPAPLSATLLSPNNSSGGGGGGLIDSLSVQHAAIGEKLVDSVNIIKELVRDNNHLRHLYDQHRADVESMQISNATLNQENEELRERTVIVDGQGDDILKSPDDGLLVDDEPAEPAQDQRDLLFELDELRAENQRLKDMVAADFQSGSSGNGMGQLSHRRREHTHSAPSHQHGMHAAGAAAVAAASAYPAVPLAAFAVTPPLSAPSTAPVHPSSSSSSSSRPGVAYRATGQALHTLTSLQAGRKGRVQSGQRRTANRPSTQQQQQRLQAKEWERARASEMERDRFYSDDSAQPHPGSGASSARHTQAWDARQPYTASSFAASAGLSAQPVSLQLGAAGPSANTHRAGPPSLVQSAALNPALAAYMQQHMQRMTSQPQQPQQHSTHYTPSSRSRY